MGVKVLPYAQRFDKYKKQGLSDEEAHTRAVKESEVSDKGKYPLVDYAKGTDVMQGQSEDVRQALSKFTTSADTTKPLSPAKKKRDKSIMKAYARMARKKGMSPRGRQIFEQSQREYEASTE